MTAILLEERAASDTELIGRARQGDREAFGELVGRHYAFVHRVAWRWAGNRADAEDIAQDVCVRVGKAIHGFKGEGAFTTWLYAMTLNAARDLKRKQVRDGAKAEAFGVHALIAGGALHEGTPEDPAERLWIAVRMLSDKQREAVMLVYGEGMNHAAAADAMGVAEATVSWHVHEAKKRLSEMMLSAGED
ncbi:RNA polymerase sigma factor [Arvimicrobium flavum]|uniref:RNA polymerase sigma factor n=1 Tax=Arvimicrobium flavum TaxID=3393320 RepID=UPI00237C1362|nr:RNA polymerase sigma factor [Mesorhizobium shangrilense]